MIYPEVKYLGATVSLFVQCVMYRTWYCQTIPLVKLKPCSRFFYVQAYVWRSRVWCPKLKLTCGRASMPAVDYQVLLKCRILHFGLPGTRYHDTTVVYSDVKALAQTYMRLGNANYYPAF